MTLDHSTAHINKKLNIIVTLPDGSQNRYNHGKSLRDLALELQVKDPVLARVDGRLMDINLIIDQNCKIEKFLSIDDQDALDVLRHSTSHIMAHAVMNLFSDVKFAIGPAIKTGFYYDFDLSRAFVPDDLQAIEKEMQKLIDQDIPFKRQVLLKEEAIKLFKEKGQTYKIELIQEIPDAHVSIYQLGDFVDLCMGPHIPSSGMIKAFKLLSIAGAYWRGDENKTMLQRIYGTVFSNGRLLNEYLIQLEEAKKRDHRKLGKELDLFSISDEVGAGMVIYHPKGAMLRMLIEDFEKKEHLRRGYNVVYGPLLLRQELWEKSGHYDNYRENMYFTEVENQKYGIKPMNCLAHMLIYKSKIHSYRDMPIRYFELGNVHRHEKSGVLHGLTRVRGFTQDDAHILCRPDQLNQEIKDIIKFVIDVMNIFKFDYHMELSTRPEKSIGTDEDWDKATSALQRALEELGIPCKIFEGEGAFYGPKIDVKLKDALERSWQCATIQCDFTLPERFDLFFIDKDGEKKRPVMLHRVILGSLERFIGILIEHYAGNFPVWLAPVQVKVMTITDRQIEYANKIVNILKENDLRAEVDIRNEKIGFKIREARLEKVPYMLILGDQEEKNETVNMRSRDTGEMKELLVDEFVNKLKEQADIKIKEVKNNIKIIRTDSYKQ